MSYKRIGFSKENSCYLMKNKKEIWNCLQIPNPRNTKEHYQWFLRKKSTKLVKQSKIITQQPRTFENPNIVDINSAIIEHLKTSYILSKTIKQDEKVLK